MPQLTPARSRKRATLFASIALIASAAIVVPSAAIAAIGDPGGARRHAGDTTKAVKAQIKGGSAKNVILLIGDGMGDSEITIARNYAFGAAGTLPGIDAMPLTGQYTTYSLYKDGPNKGKPDYVPDSSATGSAWATGTKTYDNAVSVDINGNPRDTILELAKANGYKTGNVSTAEIQDATPAVIVSHVAARSCYGPDSPTCGEDALVEGGLGSISEQLLNTRADLTLGGGSATFTQTAKAGQWNGQTLFEQAAARGYQVVDTAEELAAVGSATQAAPVLGLFTPGNFPTRYAATPATVLGADAPPVTCTENPERLTTELSLESLTTKAISLLKTKKSAKKGFFLQVEGASIDKRDHSADACGQIGETVDFDEAVQVALAFAKKDKNTLVIVTADHAHSSQLVDTTPPTSLSVALTTVEGSVMKVSYGTAAAGSSQQHTGTQLRVAAYGPQAANFVGLTDQTDTFYTMSRALRLDRSLSDLSENASATLSKRTVVPGEIIRLSAKRFNGDRQVSGIIAPASGSLPSTDVLSGKAEWSLTAPTTKGTYTITVEGAQTGTKARVKFVVR